MREIRIIEYGTIKKVIIGKRFFLLKQNEEAWLLESLNAYKRVKQSNACWFNHPSKMLNKIAMEKALEIKNKVEYGDLAKIKPTKVYYAIQWLKVALRRKYVTQKYKVQIYQAIQYLKEK